MTFRLRSTFIAMLAFCFATNAVLAGTVILGDPIPLSDLEGGGRLPVGDKVFSSFDYAATEDMPTSDAVNVIPIRDCDGNFGIRFQGGFIDLPGGSASDALIVFDVNVQPASRMKISDVHLAANVDLIGGSGLAAITETFLPDFDQLSLTVFDNGTTSQLSDWADLPELVGPGLPIETLRVQKDIILRADDAVAATLSFVDQTFSQVPEPGTFALMAIGLMGITGTSRRRR